MNSFHLVVAWIVVRTCRGGVDVLVQLFEWHGGCCHRCV